MQTCTLLLSCTHTRKTTELVEPTIKQYHGNRFIGGDDIVTSYKLFNFGFDKREWRQGRPNKGDNIVTLMDFGFDKKEWSRRCKFA